MPKKPNYKNRRRNNRNTHHLALAELPRSDLKAEGPSKPHDSKSQLQSTDNINTNESTDSQSGKPRQSTPIEGESKQKTQLPPSNLPEKQEEQKPAVKEKKISADAPVVNVKGDEKAKTASIPTRIQIKKGLSEAALLLAEFAEAFRNIEICYFTYQEYFNPKYLEALCRAFLNSPNTILAPASLPPVALHRQFRYHQDKAEWECHPQQVPIDSGNMEKLFKQLKILNLTCLKKFPTFAKLYWERQINYYTESPPASAGAPTELSIEKSRQVLIGLLQSFEALICFSPEKTANLVCQKLLRHEQLTIDVYYELILILFVGRDISAPAPNGRVLSAMVMKYIDEIAKICEQVYIEKNRITFAAASKGLSPLQDLSFFNSADAKPVKHPTPEKLQTDLFKPSPDSLKPKKEEDRLVTEVLQV